ncbi:MAG: hypothetical protein E7408_05275 [Ruminococcaceae bacterium]|nr:hypothetical protein [Oscillospiraceae bacterium]
MAFCQVYSRRIQGLSRIGLAAFQNCKELKNIAIPESVTSIAEESSSTAYRTFPISTVLIVKKDSYAHDFAEKNGLLYAFAGEDVHYEYYTENGIQYLLADGEATVVGVEDKKITAVEIPASIKGVPVTKIIGAFSNCSKLESVSLPDSLYAIGKESFRGCSSLNNLSIPVGVRRIGPEAFMSTALETVILPPNLKILSSHAFNMTSIQTVMLPGSITEISGQTPFPATAILIVPEGSYAHNYAKDNAYSCFILPKADNPDISYGAGISGSVTHADGTAATGATDGDGNVFAAQETADGVFSFENVPNGSYILKAESETGSTAKEITVFNADIAGETLTIATEAVTLSGTAEVAGRDGSRQKRIWVQVTVYNEDGVAMAQAKTDKEGTYRFAGLPVGDYAIVAETAEMRPDQKYGYDRSHTLTGYAYVNAPAAGTYTVETIVLYEENESTAKLSGKVTAQGETQDCEVILSDVFRHEVARFTADKNGKYAFDNVRDGLYFITAVTKSDGMGFAVVIVRDGRVYGNTDITVYKEQKILQHEEIMHGIPECSTREQALLYRDTIVSEKRFYDGLSQKEKKQLSEEYLERLNALSELLANCDYDTPVGVQIKNGGTVISGDELAEENTAVRFVLSVTETAVPVINETGIDTAEKFKQQMLEDAAGENEIVKYYDISLSKNGKAISSIHKQTDTTGKLRITMEIPEEYKGHTHYTFVHMHNGIPQTLVDLDDDPNTVTFEVDKFSTFALCYSDEESTTVESGAFTYANGQLTVLPDYTGVLHIASYSENGRGLLFMETYRITEETSERSFPFNEHQAAFFWDAYTRPLCDKFTIE